MIYIAEFQRICNLTIMKFIMIFNEKLYDQHDRNVELELSICALLKMRKNLRA